MNFGEWLINERKKKSLNRAEFCKKAGLRYQFLYQLEKSGRIPRKKTVLKLEKVLGKLELPEELIKEMSPAVTRMSKVELLKECKRIVDVEGIGGISYPQLKRIPGLYFALYELGITQKALVKLLGLEEEYRRFRVKTWKRLYKGRFIKMRTWESIISEAKKIVAKEGYLPPAAWFQVNGKCGLVAGVYALHKSWENLREEFKDFKSSTFIQSRNGLRWRSHPEASLSNFLFVRGIKHKRGERYPNAYKKSSGRNYGYYDLHFVSQDGEWIDVEIWGDKPQGHDEKDYAVKRKGKENFNEPNPRFLGIEFRDCFSEEKLSIILKPFIGSAPPKKFIKETDRVIPSTHWSNTDELIEYCREIALSQPNGIFPTEEWLRKRGKWKSRSGEVYNTVAVYIKTWLGGVRKLREILGQGEASTLQWDKEKALNEYKKWYSNYGITAEQARARNRRGVGDLKLSVPEMKRAANICHAILKYVGGTSEANRLLGIEINKTRKWTKEKTLKIYKSIWEKYGLVPSQFIRASSDGLLKDLHPHEIKEARQVKEGVAKHFSGERDVYEILGIKPVHIRNWMRTNGIQPPVIKRPRNSI